MSASCKGVASPTPRKKLRLLAHLLRCRILKHHHILSNCEILTRNTSDRAAGNLITEASKKHDRAYQNGFGIFYWRSRQFSLHFLKITTNSINPLLLCFGSSLGNEILQYQQSPIRSKSLLQY
jgi:hypothetical protein